MGRGGRDRDGAREAGRDARNGRGGGDRLTDEGEYDRSEPVKQENSDARGNSNEEI